MKGVFVGKKEAQELAAKWNRPRPPYPVNIRLIWDAKFDDAKEFYDLIVENSFVVKDGSGADVKITCVERKDARGMLGKKPEGSLAATQQLVKRQLALAGVIGERAVRTDRDEDMVCVLIDKLEVAPGENRYEKAIYAKAVTQGKEKFASLINSLGKHYPIDVTEEEVVKWLEERRKS